MFDHGHWTTWLVDLRPGDLLVHKGLWKFLCRMECVCRAKSPQTAYTPFCKHLLGIGQKYFLTAYGPATT